MVFWENLKIFYLAVKNNSITSCALQCNLHPSSISRHISNLERDFQQSLFEDRKKFILTEFGENLFIYINESCEKLIHLHHINSYIKLYISDVYFYNVLLHLYEYHNLNKRHFNINNVSLIEKDCIETFMDNNINNFIYISCENLLSHNNHQYMCWPIYKIPIFLYKNLGHDDYFIQYNGKEAWLKHEHTKHTFNTKYPNTVVSNSLDVITRLIHCGGTSILPNLYANYHGHIKKYEKVSEVQLFFTFHKDNLLARSILS